MLCLKLHRRYLITDVLKESGYFPYRTQLLDRNVWVKSPILDNCGSGKMPANIRCGYLTVLSGVMRGRDIYLNRFTATLVNNTEVCYCGAYKFPHREGGGECLKNKNDAWCGSCGLACYPKNVDEGIGPTEFWGIKDWHHDWVWRSDCCDSEVFCNSERTNEYTGDQP